MSLSNIQKSILQPFIDETLINLEMMAGMKGSVDDGFVDEVDKFRFKGYAICAETHGAIEGVMLMHHYIETAVAMGNAVREHVLGDSLKYDEINETMADALAEWGNTVIGRATRALGSAHLNINFEPPYFVFDTDTMASLLTGVTDIVTVPVHIESVGRFYFNYLIREVQPNAIVTEPQASTNEEGFAENHIVLDCHEAKTIDTKEKIMIVDDMRMIRSSLKRYLSQLGYINVVEAANGREAVELHKQENPAFVFMDMVMPEMTGSEALKEMKKNNPETPVVMLTSVADDEVIHECIETGSVGYVIKPLTSETGPKILAKFLIECK